MNDEARSLRIDFDTEAAFRGEYLSNISNGGAFIETNAGFAVHDAVRVDLVLQWCDQSISLEGEVVHVVDDATAGTAGRAGVAIQFSLKASDLRERFAPVMARMKADEAAVSGPGNRIARRARARVPVWVRTTDGAEYEGRSRDLSTTGTLIGLEGADLTPDDVVELTIANPVSGEEIEVHGTVMRIVPEPGGRASVGVRFEIPPGETDLVGSFLREVQISEQSRRLGGISGPVAEIGIENLLQMFGNCSPQGTLTFVNGDEEGVVAYKRGMLCGVRQGTTFGRKALSRLLNWSAGTFEFSSKASPHLHQGDPVPVDAAVLDAMRLLDESRVSTAQEFSASAKLRVDREKVAAAGRELSQAEEAILDLAAVGMSVGKVIDVIPEPDTEIRQQLQRLIDRGLIAVVD